MAILSYGYDGTVLEGGWAKLARYLGRPEAIGSTDAFKPEIVTGVDRTVRVLTGQIYKSGVLAENDANATIQSPTLASGTRWDTLVVRRDWQTNTTSLAIVTGTATKALASGLNQAPGTIEDQPIALVQITAGQQAPTALVDLRPAFTDDDSAVGTEIMWPTDTPPPGYVLEDGQALDRVRYAKLFALIGTTYGAGDGSTTFNVPNKKGRVVVGKDAAQTEFDVLGETGGAKTHTLTESEIPSHVHDIGHGHSGSSASADTWHSHDMGHGHGRHYGATYGGAGAHNHYAGTADAGGLGGGGTLVRKGWSSGGDLTSTGGAHDHSAYIDIGWFAGSTGAAAGAHSHGVTVGSHAGNSGAKGGGAAHQNLQPYIVQNFAIKAL